MKKFLFLLLIVSVLSSCAVLDYPKRIAGYSVANFENEQEGRFSFISDLEPQKAYNKCNLFIFENNLQTNFKSKKKLYIVASKFTLLYEYTLDSTETAFFISKTENNKSKIEVVSNNTRLAKFVYNKLSEYFKK